MKKCNIPELPEKLYQENNGLGERLKVEERDWNVIFSKLFFRMIIFGLFALAFWGFVKNEKTIHWNRMFVIDGVVLMYAISPLRHFRDKIILYQFGVVYQGLIRKKEYLFSKWKPDQWSKGLGLRGIRCQLEGKKFALFPFDYTYVRSFREDFQLLYLNNIAYGEEEKKDRSVPMVSSPEAAINFMIENLAGEKGITSVYAYYQTSTRQSDIDSS